MKYRVIISPMKDPQRMSIAVPGARINWIVYRSQHPTWLKEGVYEFVRSAAWPTARVFLVRAGRRGCRQIVLLDCMMMNIGLAVGNACLAGLRRKKLPTSGQIGVLVRKGDLPGTP